MLTKPSAFITTIISLALAGCGLGVPSKTFKSDTPDPNKLYHSDQGDYENAIVVHLGCEIANGIADANKKFDLPWLVSSQWGTSVTITITAEDQSGINPGLSFIKLLPNAITPFPTGGNVTSSQSFTLGVGGSGSVNATRTETIQFTFVNSALLAAAKLFPSDCSQYEKGITIDGDLRIREFIYDKALIARMGNASLYVGTPNNPATAWKWPIYNTFTETINFVSILGANATPSWKLARFSNNPSSSLVTAMRTYTNTVIITIGPIDTQPSNTQPAALSQSAQSQHNAQVQGAATATLIQGSSQ
jgi:hypothetical protein